MISGPVSQETLDDTVFNHLFSSKSLSFMIAFPIRIIGFVASKQV